MTVYVLVLLVVPVFSWAIAAVFVLHERARFCSEGRFYSEERWKISVAGVAACFFIAVGLLSGLSVIILAGCLVVSRCCGCDPWPK